MQPRPMAETFKELFPSLRFCIVSPTAGFHLPQRHRNLSIVSRTSGRLPIPMKFLPDSPGTDAEERRYLPHGRYGTAICSRRKIPACCAGMEECVRSTGASGLWGYEVHVLRQCDEAVS